MQRSTLILALCLGLASGAGWAQSQSGAPVDRAAGNGSMSTGEGIPLPSEEGDADSPSVPSSEAEMHGETVRNERAPARDEGDDARGDEPRDERAKD